MSLRTKVDADPYGSKNCDANGDTDSDPYGSEKNTAGLPAYLPSGK